jgi:hypothetical protein
VTCALDRVTDRAAEITITQDAGVNAWLLRAPWWKLAILTGLLVAPFFVLLFGLTGDRSWTAAVRMGVSVAAVCAPVLGLITANGIRDSMAATGPLPEHDRALVERASRGDPYPRTTVCVRPRCASWRIA